MYNYKIILNSAGWMDKGVLTQEDLTEINTAIEAWEAKQNVVVEPGEDEISVEDIMTEPEEEEALS